MKLLAKKYHLEILTPERQFYIGDVEAFMFEAPDGQVSILADHAPFVAPIVVGTLRIREDGGRRSVPRDLSRFITAAPLYLCRPANGRRI